MASIEGASSAEIGEKVGAALVGTFLGILVAYGFVGPIASAIEHRRTRREQSVRRGQDGAGGQRARLRATVAVEFARKLLWSDVRPSFADLEESPQRQEEASRRQGSGGMNDKADRPILIVKKDQEGCRHHGGAWKVAYADFVTA